jgi:hypothetical protein
MIVPSIFDKSAYRLGRGVYENSGIFVFGRRGTVTGAVDSGVRVGAAVRRVGVAVGCACIS